MDQSTYQRFHRIVLNTKRESKMNRTMADHVTNPLALQPKIWNNELMYPHYLFDKSNCASLKQQFSQWWDQNYLYEHSPVTDVKLIMVPDMQRTLEAFVVHKKPPKTLLQRKD